MNAKEELLEHICSDANGREVELVRVAHLKTLPERLVIEGALNDVLPKLNFIYDNEYGPQELFGYVWYTDGTWSERFEYDGSEWWIHQSRPPVDVEIM